MGLELQDTVKTLGIIKFGFLQENIGCFFEIQI